MLAKSKTQRPDCVFGLHYIMIFIFIWILGAHLHAQSTHHIYDDVLRSLFRLGSYLHVAHTFPLSGQANTIYNIINMHCVYIWCVRSNCKTQNLGRHNNTYDVVRALRVKFKRIDHTLIGWIKPRTESELQTCGTVQNRNSNARDHTFHTLFFIVLFVYLLGCWRYIYIYWVPTCGLLHIIPRNIASAKSAAYSSFHALSTLARTIYMKKVIYIWRLWLCILYFVSGRLALLFRRRWMSVPDRVVLLAAAISSLSPVTISRKHSTSFGRTAKRLNSQSSCFAFTTLTLHIQNHVELFRIYTYIIKLCTSATVARHTLTRWTDLTISIANMMSNNKTIKILQSIIEKKHNNNTHDQRINQWELCVEHDQSKI